jgi:hypothetical protein
MTLTIPYFSMTRRFSANIAKYRTIITATLTLTLVGANIQTMSLYIGNSGGGWLDVVIRGWLCPFCVVIGEHNIIAVIGSEQFF